MGTRPSYLWHRCSSCPCFAEEIPKNTVALLPSVHYRLLDYRILYRIHTGKDERRTLLELRQHALQFPRENLPLRRITIRSRMPICHLFRWASPLPSSSQNIQKEQMETRSPIHNNHSRRSDCQSVLSQPGRNGKNQSQTSSLRFLCHLPKIQYLIFPPLKSKPGHHP